MRWRRRWDSFKKEADESEELEESEDLWNTGILEYLV